ncbi:MAG: SURF1 family cytochrome oxidase biogenesis protein [Actinomycetota bacterium]
MYRFALRPRWLVVHVVIVIIGVLCAVAGFWQLDRLSERRDRNALVTQRRAQAVVGAEDVVADPDETVHRRVRAMGRYDVGREVVLIGRPNDGRPGNHVLTPLVLTGGRALVVDRGWVSPDHDSAPVVDALPPQGEVEVTGILLPSEGAAPLSGAAEPGDTVARIDVETLGRSLPYPTLPLYLALTAQQPAQRGELPDPISLAELSEGSHRLYAIQWFLFIVIGVVGYAAILRREALRGNRVSTPAAAT